MSVGIMATNHLNTCVVIFQSVIYIKYTSGNGQW